MLGTSIAWSSLELAASRTSVLLVPLAVGLSYRLAFGRLSPYLAASFVAGLVRSSGEGEQSGRFTRTDLVPGFRATIGGELGLGPGGVFLQLGYEHGRLEVPELEGRVGRILAELGYRLRL